MPASHLTPQLIARVERFQARFHAAWKVIPFMNYSLHRTLLGVVFFSCLTDASISADPPAVTLSVTDLGTLGGSGSTGYGVNNKGQVAGTSLMPGDKDVHAFFYADGKMTDLGTLGGKQSEARALNDAGQVTGNADIREKDKHHAFLWQQGHMSELGTSRADDSEGQAINAVGQVAGSVIRGGFGASHACLWSGHKVNSFDDSGAASSDSDGINGSGQVVGALREPSHSTDSHVLNSEIFSTYYDDRAVLWRSHKPTELGAAGTAISLANAINDAGQVAGAASFSPDTVPHACVWQDGRMTDLGTLAGQATVVYAINRAGLMVGGTNPNDLEEDGKKLGNTDKPQSAFCCSGGKIVDLNSLLGAASGWALTDARSVSDTGYVTGTGTHNGQPHAYLLKLPPVL